MLPLPLDRCCRCPDLMAMGAVPSDEDEADEAKEGGSEASTALSARAGAGSAVSGGVPRRNDRSATPATGASIMGDLPNTLGSGVGGAEDDEDARNEDDNGDGCAVSGGVPMANDCSRTPATVPSKMGEAP